MDDEDERAGCPRGQLDASPVPAEDSSVTHFCSDSKIAIKGHVSLVGLRCK